MVPPAIAPSETEKVLVEEESGEEALDGWETVELSLEVVAAEMEVLYRGTLLLKSFVNILLNSGMAVKLAKRQRIVPRMSRGDVLLKTLQLIWHSIRGRFGIEVLLPFKSRCIQYRNRGAGGVAAVVILYIWAKENLAT